ncbi:MAG TPA: hypothetical protein DD618_00750, partial [Acholeplasmatales bacterium]|nr:hypothetical protein [Acholeplasmatales bacterium]
AESFYAFRILPDTEYTLFSTFSNDAFLEGEVLTFYDEDNAFIPATVNCTYTYSEFGVTAITFTTPANAFYQSLAFDILYESAGGYTFFPIDAYAVLSVGDVYPGELLSAINYQGPAIDYAPVINGDDGYYYTDVENPVAVQTIQSGLVAFDDVDGDISSSITIFSDSYTINKAVLGEYPVEFRATDSSQNTASFIVYVVVVDTTAPVISGPSAYSVNETLLTPLSSFSAPLSAMDNYDGDLTASIIVSNDGYSANYNVRGTYQVLFSVTDGSENVGTFTVTVTVEDGIPPVFGGPSIINKANNAELTLASVLSQITATDAVDGVVTANIEVVDENYSRNSSRVGSWEINLSCADSMGNTSYFTLTVVVDDQTIPVFMIDQQVITIELVDNNVGVRDLIKVLVKTKAISDAAAVEVISDEYTENKNTPGTYKIVLGVDDQEMELEVRVVEGLYEQLQDANPTFWEKIRAFFGRIWRASKNFFIDLFEKIFK